MPTPRSLGLLILGLLILLVLLLLRFLSPPA